MDTVSAVYIQKKCRLLAQACEKVFADGTDLITRTPSTMKFVEYDDFLMKPPHIVPLQRAAGPGVGAGKQVDSSPSPRRQLKDPHILFTIPKHGYVADLRKPISFYPFLFSS